MTAVWNVMSYVIVISEKHAVASSLRAEAEHGTFL
jgi:hypothetical protein